LYKGTGTFSFIERKKKKKRLDMHLGRGGNWNSCDLQGGKCVAVGRKKKAFTFQLLDHGTKEQRKAARKYVPAVSEGGTGAFVVGRGLSAG